MGVNFKLAKKNDIKRMCLIFAGSLGRQRCSTSLVVADVLDLKVKTENGVGLTRLENGWFSNRFEEPLEKSGSKISTCIFWTLALSRSLLLKGTINHEDYDRKR